MVDAIRVSTDGLHVLAAHCDAAAATLATCQNTSVPGPSFLASAASVTEGHSLVEGTVAELAQRAAATGAKARTAANLYLGTDDFGANRISAVGRSIEV